jgi:hypothetical protein
MVKPIAYPEHRNLKPDTQKEEKNRTKVKRSNVRISTILEASRQVTCGAYFNISYIMDQRELPLATVKQNIIKTLN